MVRKCTGTSYFPVAVKSGVCILHTAYSTVVKCIQGVLLLVVQNYTPQIGDWSVDARRTKGLLALRGFMWYCLSSPCGNLPMEASNLCLVPCIQQSSELVYEMRASSGKTNYIEDNIAFPHTVDLFPSKSPILEDLVEFLETTVASEHIRVKNCRNDTRSIYSALSAEYSEPQTNFFCKYADVGPKVVAWNATWRVPIFRVCRMK